MSTASSQTIPSISGEKSSLDGSGTSTSTFTSPQTLTPVDKRRKRLFEASKSFKRRRKSIKKPKSVDPSPNAESSKEVFLGQNLPNSASKEAESPETSLEDKNTKWRKLDREIRWHALLYSFNIFAHDLILEIYGDISSDSTEYQDARTIHENIKAYKGQVLRYMEVDNSLYHAVLLTIRTNLLLSLASYSRTH